MAASRKSDSFGGPPGLRKSSPTAIAVLGLSLATWVFFYLKSMTLKVPEITVVVGFWLLVALAVNWVRGRLRKKGERRENH